MCGLLYRLQAEIFTGMVVEYGEAKVGPKTGAEKQFFPQHPLEAGVCHPDYFRPPLKSENCRRNPFSFSLSLFLRHLPPPVTIGAAAAAAGIRDVSARAIFAGSEL